MSGTGKTVRARKLRNNATDTEKVLWQHLRGRQLSNFKFRRQYPIGPYVVDFVCLDVRLVVELDGGQHGEQIANDARRDAYISSLGYRVVRYWNNQVLTELDAVVEDIWRRLMSPSQPPPRVGEE